MTPNELLDKNLECVLNKMWENCRSGCPENVSTADKQITSLRNGKKIPSGPSLDPHTVHWSLRVHVCVCLTLIRCLGQVFWDAYDVFWNMRTVFTKLSTTLCYSDLGLCHGTWDDSLLLLLLLQMQLFLAFNQYRWEQTDEKFIHND